VKKFIFIFIIVILLIFGGILIVTKKDNNKVETKQPVSISAKIIADNGQLIDVRTPEEYATGHAKGSINIPITTIQNGDLTKISKDRPVYLYCRTGHRAGLVKIILEENGYKNVSNIGGLIDWQKQGGETV
jgi:rhodanese-related sulfurtransferase